MYQKPQRTFGHAIPPRLLCQAQSFIVSNEMQEYGKFDCSKRIESSRSVPSFRAKGLPVLLTSNYSISSTGLFRANTQRRDLPRLVCTLHNPSMPARLALYKMQRRPARRSPTPREIVVPVDPSLSNFKLRSCSPRPSTSRRCTSIISRHIPLSLSAGASRVRMAIYETLPSARQNIINKATQRAGLDIAWSNGVLVHPSPALSPPLYSLCLALSQTRLSAQCSLPCLAADSKDEEDDMPSHPEEAVFLYLNRVKPSTGPPVLLC
jgi:hypothetical protein